MRDLNFYENKQINPKGHISMTLFKGTYDKNQIRLIAVNENNQMQIAYCKKIFRMLSWCIVAPLKSVCLKLCKEKRMEPSSMLT